MKLSVLLFALALWPLSADADTKQPSAAPASIFADPTSDGCDITLPPSDVKTVADRMYLVIDGKSEKLLGWYHPDAPYHARSIHYLANADSDMDSQVKSILMAQGLPTKPGVTTYHITAGIGTPISGGGYYPLVVTRSINLRFAHASSGGANVLVLANTKSYYKIGDKIPIYDWVFFDSDTNSEDILGPNNDFSSDKFVTLPPGRMHRITIQVQFVPKAAEKN